MTVHKPQRRYSLLAVAALFAAAGVACGERTNPLLELPPEERFFVLWWAGGSVQLETGDSVSWVKCNYYRQPRPGLEGTAEKLNCDDRFPGLVLERVQGLGYDVEVEDVISDEIWEFYMERREARREGPDGKAIYERYKEFKRERGLED